MEAAKRVSEKAVCYFERKAIKADGCWKWAGPKDKDGYGCSTAGGVYFKAHRLSYLIHVGEIADGLCVCHRCDNPECTNPDHLFLGTVTDNQRDCSRKGRKRQPKGEAVWSAKLTENQVVQIRQRYDAGESPRELAKEFGIWTTHATSICRRKSWKHVA